MVPRVISMAGVFVGILIFSLSFVWPSVFQSSGWTDEQANALSTQRGNLHNLHAQQAHASGDNKMAQEQLEELKRQIADAREKEAQESAKFEAAKSFRFGVPRWLKWIGALFVICGAAGVMVSPKET